MKYNEILYCTELDCQSRLYVCMYLYVQSNIQVQSYRVRSIVLNYLKISYQSKIKILTHKFEVGLTCNVRVKCH